MSIFGFILIFIKIGMWFVPQEKYQQKLRDIPPVEAKHVAFDMRGWEYRAVTDSSGFTHYYYYFPSAKPNAPVFLMIHGLNLDGRTFMNLTRLAADYQLVAYDFPEQTPRYTGKFDDFMGLLNDFIDVMDIRECCICGVSLGGGMALRLAAAHPDLKTGRLILVSTAITDNSPKQQRQRNSMATWIARQPDYKILWLMEKLFDRSENGNSRDTVSAVRDILRMKHPQYYRQVGMSMGSYNPVQDAQKVACPVLWLMGDKDNLFSPERTKDMYRYFPAMEHKLIAGGTHAMIYERGDEMAGHIEDFCKRHPLPESK